MVQNVKNLKVYQEAFQLLKEVYLYFKDVKTSLRLKE